VAKGRRASKVGFGIPHALHNMMPRHVSRYAQEFVRLHEFVRLNFHLDYLPSLVSHQKRAPSRLVVEIRLYIPRARDIAGHVCSHIAPGRMAAIAFKSWSRTKGAGFLAEHECFRGRGPASPRWTAAWRTFIGACPRFRVPAPPQRFASSRGRAFFIVGRARFRHHHHQQQKPAGPGPREAQ
jgi:hypothetical protein